MEVTLLSSVLPQYLNVTTHQVAAVEDEGLRVVHSYRLASILEDVAQAILEVSPYGVTVPITKVVWQPYSLLMRLVSRAFNCYSDWMQESFTTQKLGSYLNGPIRNRP